MIESGFKLSYEILLVLGESSVLIILFLTLIMECLELTTELYLCVKSFADLDVFKLLNAVPLGSHKIQSFLGKALEFSSVGVLLRRI